MNQAFKRIKNYFLLISIRFGLEEFAAILKWLRYGTYSHDREDILVNKILKGKKKGFYVDVGAHSPIKVSNINIGIITILLQ